MYNLIVAINSALARNNTNYKQWCHQNGLAYSTAYGIYEQRRPGDKVLHALCNGWPDDSGLHIAHAHLEDELERAGRTPDEIHIILRADNATGQALDQQD